MRRNEGFTLVELLIVLAVIAALLATITPVALNAVKKAKATQVAQNLRNIKAAVEQYIFTEQPSSPATLDLSTLVTNNYLSSQPTNYEVYVSGFDDGEAVATVVYTGLDVDFEKVQQAFPEAKQASGTVGVASDDHIYVDFTIAKYW